MLTSTKLLEILEALGAVLARQGHSYEIVVVGGSALLLSGTVERPTQDLDIVALVEDDTLRTARPLPVPLSEAAKVVGDTYGLPNNWLNAGPTDLLTWGLPDGFLQRATRRRFSSLNVVIAHRYDLICLKVYAAADYGPNSRHVADLKALQATETELIAGARWARSHDPSSAFAQELAALLRYFGSTVQADDI